MCGDAKRVTVALSYDVKLVIQGSIVLSLFLEIIDQGRLVLNYWYYQLIYVNL